MAAHPRTYGEPDYAPLFLAGLAGMTGLGLYLGVALYDRLRAARLAKQPQEPTPTPPAPPPEGEPAS